MKFSIITPTCHRPEKLKRALTSLLTQTHKSWEMIIVNDSPEDKNYDNVIGAINDSRIHYFVNKYNQGVNFTRNFALEQVATNSDWIIFLDDDDYLAEEALAFLAKIISENKEVKWLVTNRATAVGVPMTHFPIHNHFYSYGWSYLLLKHGKGDATHSIKRELLERSSAVFSKTIKQGEEWFFFYQIGLHAPLYYVNHNTTLSDGYDTTHGLNFRKRSMLREFKNLFLLFREGRNKKILTSYIFILYLSVRTLRAPLRFFIRK